MKLQGIGKQFAGGVFLVVALLLAPTRAVAQVTRVEVSGGWSYAHEPEVSIPAGWYASGGGYLNNWLGIVGEVSGHYKTISEFGIDVKTSMHLFGAGPKFAYRRNPRFTPYVQALFGGGRAKASVLSFEETLSGFSYQPSGGVEINNSSGSLGVRVAVGRAGIRSEGEWFTDTLFNVGVVIRR